MPICCHVRGDERSIYELFWCASQGSRVLSSYDQQPFLCSSKEKIQNGRAGIMDRTGTVHQHWVYWIHSTLFHHSPVICRSARWLRPVRSCELTPQVCCGEERWPRTPPLLPCSTIFHRWVMGLGFMWFHGPCRFHVSHDSWGFVSHHPLKDNGIVISGPGWCSQVDQYMQKDLSFDMSPRSDRRRASDRREGTLRHSLESLGKEEIQVMGEDNQPWFNPDSH